jgi:hypothetical protein
MHGKRVQFDEETWNDLDLLARDSMREFQELADKAFPDEEARPAGRPPDGRQSGRCSPTRLGSTSTARAAAPVFDRPSDGWRRASVIGVANNCAGRPQIVQSFAAFHGSLPVFPVAIMCSMSAGRHPTSGEHDLPKLPQNARQVLTFPSVSLR